MDRSTRLLLILLGLIIVPAVTFAAYRLANASQEYTLAPAGPAWVESGSEDPCDPQIFYTQSGQRVDVPVGEYSGAAPLLSVNAASHPSRFPPIQNQNPGQADCAFQYDAPAQLDPAELAEIGLAVYPLEIQFQVAPRIRAGESVPLTTRLLARDSFSAGPAETVLTGAAPGSAALSARIHSPNLVVSPAEQQKTVTFPPEAVVSEEQWVIGASDRLKGSQSLFVDYRITAGEQVFAQGAVVQIQVTDVYGLNPFLTAALTGAGSLAAWALLITTNVFGLLRRAQEGKGDKGVPRKEPGGGGSEAKKKSAR